MASSPSEAVKRVPDLNPPGKAQRLEAGAQKPAAPPAPKAPPTAKPPKAPKAPAEPKAPRTSLLKKAYPDNGVITLLVETNPKRPGTKSYDRYAQYKNGMSVKAAVEAGVLYQDLSWDVGHNFIRVEIPPTAADATPAETAAPAAPTE